mmetsp:Transcript_16572/g.23367  ORF Transcript_16572/g.23367 Transcript_16572/m.23367 type:complete len:147 (+) Transcript_16572:160-600(+)
MVTYLKMAKVFDYCEEDGRDECPVQESGRNTEQGELSELHQATRPQQCEGKLSPSIKTYPCNESLTDIEKSLMVSIEESLLHHNNKEEVDKRKQVDSKRSVHEKDLEVSTENSGTKRGRFLVVPFPGGRFRGSFDLAAFGSSCVKR